MSPGRTGAAHAIGVTLILGLAAPLSAQGLSGEWGGARPWLGARGLSVEAAVTVDALANLLGGIDPGARGLRGNGDLVLSFDTGPLLWPGALAVLYFQAGRGGGITERGTGAAQSFSNLEAHDFAQLSEAFLEQRLLAGRVRLALGKLDANRDFGTPRHAVTFLNGSFGAPPTVPLPSFPRPAAGLVLTGEPHRRLLLRAGIYDGASAAAAFGGAGGVFLVGSGVLRWGFEDPTPHGFVGVGFWHHTGRFTSIPAASPDPGAAVEGSAGLYLITGTRLFALPWSGQPGLYAFARAGTAPGDRAPVSGFAGGGLLLRGPIEGRTDAAGVAVSAVRLPRSLHLGVTEAIETVVELVVKIALAPGLIAQPDVQLTHRPGGDLPSSLAAAVRLLILL